jgi:hypothetical protein
MFQVFVSYPHYFTFVANIIYFGNITLKLHSHFASTKYVEGSNQVKQNLVHDDSASLP